jgi:hypothetical protein
MSDVTIEVPSVFCHVKGAAHMWAAATNNVKQALLERIENKIAQNQRHCSITCQLSHNQHTRHVE